LIIGTVAHIKKQPLITAVKYPNVTRV